MKVLLINPPIRECAKPSCFPSGLGYIAAVLLKEGHKVEVLDINAFRYSKEEVVCRIKEINCDLVGIGGLVTVYKYVKWLISAIKRVNPKVKIIVGGTLASSIPDLLLEKTKTDVAVINEGEITIKELIEAIAKNKSLTNIDGIYFREGDGIYKTKPREVIKNINMIPFPAWDLFPIKQYVNTPDHLTGPIRNLNMITSRGCPYQCAFCYRNFGRKIRLRSPENLVQEMILLKNKYGVRFFSFVDELFTVSKTRIYEICDLIMRENLKVKWGCLSRVNLADKAVLRVMKRAGCNFIGYGIESWSQTILDNIKKQVTVDQAKEAIRITRKAGIFTNTTHMIGNIGETQETIQETVNFCKELNITLQFFYATPFPKTALYTQAQKMGLILDEEKYIENLGECSKFSINLTKFKDEELIELKKKAEAETISAQGGVIRRALNYYKNYGGKAFIQKVVTKLLGRDVYKAME